MYSFFFIAIKYAEPMWNFQERKDECFCSETQASATWRTQKIFIKLLDKRTSKHTVVEM